MSVVEESHRRISYSTPFDAADAASGRRVSLREMPSFKSEVKSVLKVLEQ